MAVKSNPNPLRGFLNDFSIWEVSSVLGVQTASSLRETYKLRWGALAPHLNWWVSRREEAVWTPKTNETFQIEKSLRKTSKG